MANIMIDKILTGFSSIPAALEKMNVCFVPKADIGGFIIILRSSYVK